jgi:TPP-dependent pyruvate/acetoin dehydrogenase alpha subunit
MLRARRFDETLIAHADMITGVFHVSIGMEATAAGLAATRAPTDLIMLNHRNHGALAAIGSDPAIAYGEVLGRDGGPQRGRAGSLHLADAAAGVLYTSAMVAGGVALAVGMALAKRRLRREGIVYAFFGDGAMGEGAMYESLNLAQLWSAPVLFVCESNAAAEPGRASAFQAARSIVELAQVHQVPAVAVDASDAEAVCAAMAEASAQVRTAGGPRFIEARSQPWPGNRGFLPTLEGGPLDLRDATRAPDQSWAAGDPILLEARAQLRDGISIESILALDAAIAAEAREAFDRAAAAPPAPRSAAFSDVWSCP